MIKRILNICVRRVHIPLWKVALALFAAILMGYLGKRVSASYADRSLVCEVACAEYGMQGEPTGLGVECLCYTHTTLTLREANTLYNTRVPELLKRPWTIYDEPAKKE